jgi:hypothetical protein
MAHHPRHAKQTKQIFRIFLTSKEFPGLAYDPASRMTLIAYAAVMRPLWPRSRNLVWGTSLPGLTAASLPFCGQIVTLEKNNNTSFH